MPSMPARKVEETYASHASQNSRGKQCQPSRSKKRSHIIMICVPSGSRRRNISPQPAANEADAWKNKRQRQRRRQQQLQRRQQWQWQWRQRQPRQWQQGLRRRQWRQRRQQQWRRHPRHRMHNRDMMGTSILHHSMEGTSSNRISNSTHNRGSQRTCARTESSMAEQYEYIASMAPPF